MLKIYDTCKLYEKYKKCFADIYHEQEWTNELYEQLNPECFEYCKEIRERWNAIK